MKRFSVFFFTLFLLLLHSVCFAGLHDYPRIAVLDFTNDFMVADVDIRDTKSVTNYAIEALIDSDRFNVMERSQLQALAREHHLNMTGLIDPSSAAQVGKMLGVQIDSETILENLSVSSDIVRSKVQGLVQGARIIDEGLNEDGSYFVKMRVPMYGTQSSIASVALPKLRENIAPEPLPEVTDTVLPKKEVKALQGAGYTGIVVNADEMGLEPTFSPVIYDVNGRIVYGIKNLDYDYAISQGMVAYASTLENAMHGNRAGENPLVINAVSVRGGRNSVNKVNVVVSVEDGDRILLACEKSNILQQAAVVFVR